jgi:hypothetical protein
MCPLTAPCDDVDDGEPHRPRRILCGLWTPVAAGANATQSGKS